MHVGCAGLPVKMIASFNCQCYFGCLITETKIYASIKVFAFYFLMSEIKKLKNNDPFSYFISQFFQFPLKGF